MKRFLAFIVLLIYSVTTIGATVQLHYCMGKLSGWSFGWLASGSAKCNKCGMQKTASIDRGCCKDENKLLKIQNDQKVDYSSLEISKLSVTAPVFSNQDFETPLPPLHQPLPQINAPPPSRGIDICIYNSVFRI
jgi:hypothetical protein